jgi:hypothetical protein
VLTRCVRVPPRHATQAFDTLSDPGKRDTYNRHGAEAVDGAPHMHNPFAGFGGFGGGAGGGAGFQSADMDELLRNLFGGGGGGFAGGFGGMPRARPQYTQQQQRPQQGQQQQQQQQQQQHQGEGFTNPFAGLNLQGIVPFLPVLLMLAGQLVSVVPFLARVRRPPRVRLACAPTSRGDVPSCAHELFLLRATASSLDAPHRICSSSWSSTTSRPRSTAAG